MKVLRASLVHQVQPALGEKFQDVLVLGSGGVESMSVVGQLLIVNGRKGISMAYVLWVDLEPEAKGKRP